MNRSETLYSSYIIVPTKEMKTLQSKIESDTKIIISARKVNFFDTFINI